jgi:hypothetical protein
MGLPPYSFLSFITGESGVRGIVVPIWVRNVFNYSIDRLLLGSIESVKYVLRSNNLQFMLKKSNLQ